MKCILSAWKTTVYCDILYPLFCIFYTRRIDEKLEFSVLNIPNSCIRNTKIVYKKYRNLVYHIHSNEILNQQLAYIIYTRMDNFSAGDIYSIYTADT